MNTSRRLSLIFLKLVLISGDLKANLQHYQLFTSSQEGLKVHSGHLGKIRTSKILPHTGEHLLVNNALLSLNVLLSLLFAPNQREMGVAVQKRERGVRWLLLPVLNPCIRFSSLSETRTTGRSSHSQVQVRKAMKKAAASLTDVPGPA